MDGNKIKEDLLRELYKLRVHNLTANKKEISIRCPYCGDSRKNSRSSHLYINIDPTSEKFLQNYCQRCKSKGYTNSDFLRSLHINNQQLVIDIEKNGKEQKRNMKYKFKSGLKRTRLKLPTTYDKKDRINVGKLRYINKRLGTNLTFEDLAKYKIILNLYDVLELNNIKKLSCRERFGETLDRLFVGFVSYDNNYIVMRNLSSKVMTDLRYHNYNIFNNYDNTKKFYIVPTQMDVLTDEITLVLSEGIFDILVVYFHIEKEHKQTLFSAVCGIGYYSVIHEIIKLGFLNINLKIYGDNDQDIRQYKTIKTDFFPFVKKITLYINTANKDFGDYTQDIEIKELRL